MCEWVISRTNEACHVWTHRVSYEQAMSRMHKPQHIRTSHRTYEQAMTHIFIWEVMTPTSILRKTNFVLSRINNPRYTRHELYWSEILYVLRRVLVNFHLDSYDKSCFPHIFIREVLKLSSIFRNKSHRTCMSHVTGDSIMSRMNAPCHVYMSLDIHESCPMSMRHVTYNVSCHLPMRYVTYQCIMSHIDASCHISMRHVTY